MTEFELLDTINEVNAMLMQIESLAASNNHNVLMHKVKEARAVITETLDDYEGTASMADDGMDLVMKLK